MSGATDSGMVKTMCVVMACVSVLGLVCVMAARMLSAGSDDYTDPMQRNALIQRIQPTAAVRTSADDLVVAETTTAMAEGSAKTGEELANGACAACHIAGAAGAPKFGDEQAWAERRELGLDALVASVINGKGAMPARGGSPYSDDEIRAAVEYMAMFEDTGAAAEPETPAESDDTANAAPVEQGTETETAASDTAAEKVVAEAVAAITDESAGAAAMTALVVGEVPEGLTDNIKGAVDGICASCHVAGVAGAPKNGDKAAWQERADKGLEALTASVINGLNVMPARGGSTLSDAEIPVAIQYLMSK